MKYEIPREAFKQRLENRLNFVFVDLQAGTSPVNFENVEKLSYGPQFKEEFSAKFPEKTQNVILFNMSGDGAPAKAAQELADAGYHFVYYYNGTSEDHILDKGLN